MSNQIDTTNLKYILRTLEVDLLEEITKLIDAAMAHNAAEVSRIRERIAEQDRLVADALDYCYEAGNSVSRVEDDINNAIAELENYEAELELDFHFTDSLVRQRGTNDGVSVQKPQIEIDDITE